MKTGTKVKPQMHWIDIVESYPKKNKKRLKEKLANKENRSRWT